MITPLQKKAIITLTLCVWNTSHLQAMKVNSPTYRTLIENTRTIQSLLAAPKSDLEKKDTLSNTKATITSTPYDFNTLPIYTATGFDQSHKNSHTIQSSQKV